MFGPKNAGPAKLRELMRQPEIIPAPGAYDALTARLVEGAGFPCVYITGHGVSVSTLGESDVGLLTMPEMLDRVRQIASQVSVPIIADADNGYGNPINVWRTVREFEAAGAAAIHMEDQVWPKRCGHMPGKKLVPMEEMVAKIRAAVEARTNPDFVIIARTDARAVTGLEDAIRRGKAYGEAGADVIFVDAPESVEDLKAARAIGYPLLANMTEGGKTPLLPIGELQALGYKIVIFPLTTMYTATLAVQQVLQHLKQHGNTEGFLDRMLAFHDFNRFIGLEKIWEMERRYVC